MDPYRLPRTVVPLRYELRLEPDLASASFQGEETVSVRVDEPTAEVVLNAAELTIAAAEARHDDGRVLAARVTLEPEAERCTLTFPQPLARGAWRLHLTF